MIQYKPKALSICKEHSRWGGGEGVGGRRLAQERKKKRKGCEHQSSQPCCSLHWLLRRESFLGSEPIVLPHCLFWPPS